MTSMGIYERALLEHFEGCYSSPGGEVWVRLVDALAALALAEEMGLRVLGMEGFIVDEAGTVFPAMSRITDYSAASPAEALAAARAMLAAEWAVPPTDVHADASGHYMIDVVVADPA
jgi:hypothetical protein